MLFKLALSVIYLYSVVLYVSLERINYSALPNAEFEMRGERGCRKRKVSQV